MRSGNVKQTRLEKPAEVRAAGLLFERHRIIALLEDEREVFVPLGGGRVGSHARAL
jgi:hypothetical protein